MAFNLKNYEEVKDRLPRFYEKFTDGRITTSIKKLSDDFKTVIIEAKIYANAEDQKQDLPLANGIAFEVETQKGVNATSHIENCETSAIGRALANMNFIKGQTRPSREEMEKVQRMQEQKEKETEAKNRLVSLYKKCKLDKAKKDSIVESYKIQFGEVYANWKEENFKALERELLGFDLILTKDLTMPEMVKLGIFDATDDQPVMEIKKLEYDRKIYIELIKQKKILSKNVPDETCYFDAGVCNRNNKYYTTSISNYDKEVSKKLGLNDEKDS